MSKIKGAAELRAKIRRIPQKYEDEIVNWADKSARELVGYQKALAPVDTGELVRSFEIRRSAPPRIGVRVIAGDGPIFWEMFQEFGTKPHGDNPGVKALNYFFGPYRLLRKKLRGRVKRAVNKAAKEVAGRG